MVRITGRGRKVAAAHPERVDVGVLSEFPEFIEFKSRSHAPRPTGQPELAKNEATPREAVSTAVDEANAAVASEVLDRVRQREAAFLERLVLAVLTAMGYGGAAGAAEHLGKSGDEGLDGVIRQDPLGTGSHLRPGQAIRREQGCRTAGDPGIRRSPARCPGGSGHLYHHEPIHAGGHPRMQTGWPPESS